MVALLLLHLLAAALAPALTRLLDRKAFVVMALVPLAAFVWLLGPVHDAVTDGTVTTQTIDWIPGLGLDIDLSITPLTGVMSMVVTLVGALVLFYCAWYFRPGDPGLWRFSAVLTAFAGSMLGLVLADNLYVLYVFWELTTVLSYLLIGHNPERRANRRAAMTALLVTTFGGLAMLVGFVILAQQSGTSTLTGLVADPPSGTAVTVAVMLVLLGALSKSALVPFHFWLPGAMAAPTPVSAYLHAAAMVKAGVYLVALMAPAFATVPGWRPVLLVLGIATMVIGGLRALRQYDIKLLLAYGTVSQLGFLVAVIGVGTRTAAFAGLALVCAHALFKATLFLVVGIIDRCTGTRDLRELTGLHRRLPVLFGATILAAASMAGVPPLFGFTAKEAAFVAFEDLGTDADLGGWGALALAGIVVGSLLTVAYTARFVWGAFGSRDVQAPELTPPSAGFLASPVILAAACLVAGVTGGVLTPWLSTYADQYPEGLHEPELTLWHGVSLPLLLSLLCLVGGMLLWLGRRPVARLQDGLASALPLPEAERVYYATVRGVDRLSVEVTSRTQRGSLPFYVAVILIVLVAAPGSAAIAAWGDLDVRLWDDPLQLAVAVPMIAGAILTVRSRRRLRAVLLLGVTGYGVALLFVAHGAPDLALTQVLVETFLLVTFVLVMRRLPPFFSDRPFTTTRLLRITIGVLCGLAVSGFALLASGARTADPIGQEFAGPAYDYGGGKNIVNVTLVDIRAWDTLGELSVLVVAATGIASLIYLINDRAMSHRTRRRKVRRITSGVLPGVASLAAERRSLVFEVVTRLVFHVLIVVSLYLMIAGHNDPGGGFAGGLVAGLALMVRYLAGGRKELDAAAPIDAGVVLGLGLAIAAISGLVPTLVGGGVLQSAIVDLDVPVLGTLHIVTSVVFDVGVYLVVVGLALDVLRSLGGGIDRHREYETDAEPGQEHAEVTAS